MNPFLKALACAQYEEIHVAAWPVYPPASSLQYPDPYTNISEMQSEHVTPAYAYETGTWTLAPAQVVTREGARLNLPKRLQQDESALDAEMAVIGNGFTRIYRPDGYRAVEDPSKTFEGLVIVDVDLDENLLTKRLADFVCNIRPQANPIATFALTPTGHREATTCGLISFDYWWTRHPRHSSSMLMVQDRLCRKVRWNDSVLPSHSRKRKSDGLYKPCIKTKHPNSTNNTIQYQISTRHLHICRCGVLKHF